MAQQEIPGVLDKVVKLPNLTRACRTLDEQRTQLGELRLEMGKTKESIEKQMIDNKLTSYPFDGGVVYLKPGKTRITIKKSDGSSSGEGETDEVED